MIRVAAYLSQQPLRTVSVEMGLTRFLLCECGFRVDADREDELVRLAQAHARLVHAMEFTAAQILTLAREAESRETNPKT